MKWEPVEEHILPFFDRESAASVLAEKLKDRIEKNTLVLAIPRGGVVTGKVLAKKLGLELDLILCKKVGHPFNPEYAIGSACADGSSLLTDSSTKSNKVHFEKESKKLSSWLQKRYTELTNRLQPVAVRDRSILLCDDGVATGSTMLAAVHSLQKQGAKKILVATPVISVTALAQLSNVTDAVYYLCAPHPFGAVGEFYSSFSTVTDHEVRSMFIS